MTDGDLSKLKTERGASAPLLLRRSRRLILAVDAVAALMAGVLGWNAFSSRALDVEVAT